MARKSFEDFYNSQSVSLIVGKITRGAKNSDVTNKKDHMCVMEAFMLHGFYHSM